MFVYMKQLLIVGLSLSIISCNNNVVEKPELNVFQPSVDSIGGEDFIVNLPRVPREERAFLNFVDSLNLEMKFVSCDNLSRNLYFDSTTCLVAERVEYITSGEPLSRYNNIGFIRYTPENLLPSFFFTEATGKNYYYDSTKQKLIELPYSELSCRDNGQEFIKVGLGLQPNVKYAFLNAKTLEPICDFIYERIDDFVDGFATVTKNSLIGILNERGEEILPCDYETIYPYVDDALIIVERDGKYGLFDTEGNKLISCEHGSIVYFEDGFALVEKEYKYGIFDTKKQKTTACTYESKFIDNKIVEHLTDGNFYYAWYDEFKITPKDFFFEDGFALVTKNGAYGLLDDKGKEVIPCLYERIDLFVEKGLAIVEKDGKYGMFNTRGKEILPCDYGHIKPYLEDGFVVTERYNEPAEYQMINTKGKAISRKYENIFNFEDEFAIAERDDKELLISKKGKEISSEYKSIDYFNTRFAIAKNENEHVIINTKGEEVSRKYERIECCINCFLVVKRNGKYGIINMEGKEVVACKYEYEKIYKQVPPLEGAEDVKSSISKE